MAIDEKLLARGEDGVVRCRWCGRDPLYVRYHDEEWGMPVADEHRLFEKVCLEGFQAGLSWLTILKKREAFRKAFLQFDFHRVARLELRRAHHQLRVHAGHGPGQGPRPGLRVPRPGRKSSPPLSFADCEGPCECKKFAVFFQMK